MMHITKFILLLLLTSSFLYGSDSRTQSLVGEVVRLIQLSAQKSENRQGLRIDFESKEVNVDGGVIYKNTVVTDEVGKFTIHCSVVKFVDNDKVEAEGHCIVDRGSMRHYAGENGIVILVQNRADSGWELKVSGEGQLIYENLRSQE